MMIKTQFKIANIGSIKTRTLPSGMNIKLLIKRYKALTTKKN